jgi:transposase
MGEQFVGIDLHRRSSVIVRMTGGGQVLETVRIDNDPVALSLELAKAGPDPEVVLEATYGWYWAADLLQACGARVHLAHPLGIKMFGYQRVKTDARDSTNLAELLRMGRLPEAWLAPPQVRELRELVRYRAKLVALRSGLKAQVHAVLAKQGVRVPMSDLFGVAGSRLLDEGALRPGGRPGPRASAVARTRLIDDLVTHALASCSIGQLVVLGAGFDARADRLPGLEEVTVFEVDHPATQQAKRQALAGIVSPPASHVRFVALLLYPWVG